MSFAGSGVWCVWCAALETLADHRRLHPLCEDCLTLRGDEVRATACLSMVRTFGRPQHHTEHAGLDGLAGWWATDWDDDAGPSTAGP